MRKSVALILILFSACGTTDSDPEIDEPVTQGIVMTDETGLEIGMWRPPSSPSPQSDDFRLSSPYPNPFSSTTNFSLEIGSIRQVDIWVVPVRIPEETESRYVKEFGPESVTDERIVTITSTELQAGFHTIQWEPNLPRGFYRIYAESNEETLWRDVFIGSPGESQQEMINYLNSLDN